MDHHSPDDFTAHWAKGELGEVVVSAKEVHDRVNELGRAITEDYAEHPPLLVCVLKGAINFMSDLMRAIALPVEVDFMAVASYGNSTRSSGVVRIVKDLDLDLAGRHVLVVEDIVDSGLTLKFLLRMLAARNPAIDAVFMLQADKIVAVEIEEFRGPLVGGKILLLQFKTHLLRIFVA